MYDLHCIWHYTEWRDNDTFKVHKKYGKCKYYAIYMGDLNIHGFWCLSGGPGTNLLWLLRSHCVYLSEPFLWFVRGKKNSPKARLVLNVVKCAFVVRSVSPGILMLLEFKFYFLQRNEFSLALLIWNDFRNPQAAKKYTWYIVWISLSSFTCIYLFIQISLKIFVNAWMVNYIFSKEIKAIRYITRFQCPCLLDALWT